LKRRNFACQFRVRQHVFFQVCAVYITGDFSVSDARARLSTFPILPVKLKDYQGATFDLTFAIKACRFSCRCSKSLRTRFRRWDFMTRFFSVGLNIGVVEKRLPVFNPGKSVADIGFAGRG